MSNCVGIIKLQNENMQQYFIEELCVPTTQSQFFYLVQRPSWCWLSHPPCKDLNCVPLCFLIVGCPELRKSTNKKFLLNICLLGWIHKLYYPSWWTCMKCSKYLSQTAFFKCINFCHRVIGVMSSLLRI